MTPPPTAEPATHHRELDLLERLSDAVLCLDGSARVRAFSPETPARLGVRPDALLGAAGREWLLEHDADRLASAVEAGSGRLRVHRLSPSGPVRATLTLTDLRADPSVAAVVAACVDDPEPEPDQPLVSPLHATGCPVRVNDVVASVFHQSPVPSALLTPDGVFLEVNTALTDLLGHDAADLVGTPVASLDRPIEGPVTAGTRRWLTRSGREVWVEASRGTVAGIAGAGAYLIEHYVDVTAHLSSEDEVRMLNSMLAARVAELNTTQAHLAAAFRKINQVREDERRQLAVELHDDTVQRLIAATWMLDELDPDDTDEAVREVRTTLQGTIDGVRDIITDLRPPSLDTLPLAEALEHRARTVLGDEVALDVVDEAGEALPVEIRSLVYRTAMEAVHNIRKHAQASAARIRISHAGGAVTVEVCDNGVGFDDERAADRASRGHIGVSSMREQMLLAGGVFHIGARADGRCGTEVSFTLPQLHAESGAFLGGWRART